MIAVPLTVLDALAGMYGASADQLDRFGGGIVMNDRIQPNPPLPASWKQMILSQPDAVGALPEITIV